MQGTRFCGRTHASDVHLHHVYAIVAALGVRVWQVTIAIDAAFAERTYLSYFFRAWGVSAFKVTHTQTHLTRILSDNAK